MGSDRVDRFASVSVPFTSQNGILSEIYNKFDKFAVRDSELANKIELVKKEVLENPSSFVAVSKKVENLEALVLNLTKSLDDIKQRLTYTETIIAVLRDKVLEETVGD